jgi:hypothetical protein
MAKAKKMTVDEYITNREDMTHLMLAEGPLGLEIVLRLDGTYHDEAMAREQLKFVSKNLGIPIGEFVRIRPRSES